MHINWCTCDVVNICWECFARDTVHSLNPMHSGFGSTRSATAAPGPTFGHFHLPFAFGRRSSVVYYRLYYMKYTLAQQRVALNCNGARIRHT